MEFRLLTLMTQIKKKTDYDAKIKDIDNQIRNHDKYITANDLINS